MQKIKKNLHFAENGIIKISLIIPGKDVQIRAIDIFGRSVFPAC